MTNEELKNPDTNLATENRNVFVYTELDYGYIEKICTMYRRKVVPVCIITVIIVTMYNTKLDKI